MNTKAIADPVYSICRTNNFVGSTGGDNDNNNNEDENDFVLTAFSPVIVGMLRSFFVTL